MTLEKKIERAARLLKEAEQEIKEAGVFRLKFKITLKLQKPKGYLGMFSSSKGKFSNSAGEKTAPFKK
jgi:hypothetical protein